MSARVLNPLMLSELYKIRPPTVRTHIPSAVSLAKIKRDLFGPVDKEDAKRFVDTELAKHQLAASKRWGFDFVRGYPINEQNQYTWERVPPTNAPEMYTLSPAAHAREANASASCSPSLEDLLDERSERSNRKKVVNISMEGIEPITAQSCNITSEASTSQGSIREKRQPKITDYLKERKRLTPTPKKISPSKKSRTSISFTLRQ